jgi:predicted AAA+ superfamily ATPase
MKYIKRAMEETFEKLNKQFSAILITGPRQVGKTRSTYRTERSIKRRNIKSGGRGIARSRVGRRKLIEC